MTTERTELRGLCPVDLVSALDALAHAEGLDRNSYVNRILDGHVKQVCHKTILVTRMLRGNAYLAEDSGISA